MFDWVLIVVALAMGGSGLSVSDASQIPLQAEDQVPTGKFTTAVEVRPILDATKTNWVALREYEGQDLLYLTHLISWRCGLVQLRIAVNGAEMRSWPLPPCLAGTATPNAIRAEDGLPYAAFALQHIEQIQIEITYDDLTTDGAVFTRAEVLTP